MTKYSIYLGLYLVWALHYVMGTLETSIEANGELSNELLDKELDELDRDTESAELDALDDDSEEDDGDRVIDPTQTRYAVCRIFCNFEKSNKLGLVRNSWTTIEDFARALPGKNCQEIPRGELPEVTWGPGERGYLCRFSEDLDGDTSTEQAESRRVFLKVAYEKLKNEVGEKGEQKYRMIVREAISFGGMSPEEKLGAERKKWKLSGLTGIIVKGAMGAANALMGEEKTKETFGALSGHDMDPEEELKDVEREREEEEMEFRESWFPFCRRYCDPIPHMPKMDVDFVDPNEGRKYWSEYESAHSVRWRNVWDEVTYQKEEFSPNMQLNTILNTMMGPQTQFLNAMVMFM